MKKTVISTESAPQAIGPYSQAVISKDNKLIFTAGQIPINPKTGEIVTGDIQVQTRQVMENLQAILEAAGSGLEHIVKTTIYLHNMDDFKAINEIYGQFFPAEPPARSTVEVSRLPRDVGIEIDCIAQKAE